MNKFDEIERQQQALQDTFSVIVLALMFIGALSTLMLWVSWEQLIELKPLAKLFVLIIIFVSSSFICKKVFGLIKHIYYTMYY